MDQTQIVRTFLSNQTYMVLATTSNDIPEAAVVGFYAKEDLTLIFGTSTTSRKFQNIQNNSRVALVVSSVATSVQLEGVVSVLIGKEIEEDKAKLFEKIPAAKIFAEDPNQAYFKIMPVWARYTDYSEGKATVFEIRF